MYCLIILSFFFFSGNLIRLAELINYTGNDKCPTIQRFNFNIHYLTVAFAGIFEYSSFTS